MNLSFSEISRLERDVTPEDISRIPHIILAPIGCMVGKTRIRSSFIIPDKTVKKITKAVILSIDIPARDMLLHITRERELLVLFSF